MIELLYALLVTLTGLDRQVDGGLAAFAQERSAAVACGSTAFYTHAGKAEGVAEILICFPAGGDVAQLAADGWMASAPHRSVLTNATYRRIGCGATETNGSVMVACELAPGIPDTALPLPVDRGPVALFILASILAHFEYRRIRRARDR